MRPFRLLHLPILQLKRVIFLMDNCQRVKLAVCSKVAENAITQADIRTHALIVFLNENIHIVIKAIPGPPGQSSDVQIYFNGLSEPVKREFKEEKIDKKVLSSCYQKENDREVHFDLTGKDIKFDTVDLLKWMSRMFPRAKIGWSINLDTIGPSVFERLFPVPLFNQAYYLKLENGELCSTNLTEMMDRMNRIEFFYIYSTIAPNFSHPKALSYDNIHYEDARWMKVENLMLMKNPFTLSVKKTYFYNEDLNEYLKHWRSSPDNVMGRMDLYLKGSVRIGQHSILRSFTAHRDKTVFTILCDNYLEREHPLAFVYFPPHKEAIFFRTIGKEEYPQQYEVLVLSHKVRELEEKIKEVDFQKNQCQSKFTVEDEQEAIGMLRKYRELETTRKEVVEQLTAVERRKREAFGASQVIMIF